VWTLVAPLFRIELSKGRCAWTLVAQRSVNDLDSQDRGTPGYPLSRCGLWSLATWTLVARLAVIPWTLVAHSNNRRISFSNSLRGQSPN
jgi:hypothetical protein